MGEDEDGVSGDSTTDKQSTLRPGVIWCALLLLLASPVSTSADNALEDSSTEDGTGVRGGPTVVSSVPMNGSSAYVKTRVTLSFSAAMDQQTLTTAISIWPTNKSYFWNYHYDGRSAEMSYWQGLKPNTTHFVNVSTAARDTQGNQLESPFHLVFNTTLVPTAPYIFHSSPGNGSKNVKNQGIAIEFDQDMNTSSKWLIRIVPSSEGQRWMSQGSFNWYPTNGLIVNTTYTVEVLANITSEAGIAMGRPYNFSFETPNAWYPPAILWSKPKDEGYNVALDANVSVKFNQAMQAHSVRQAFHITPNVGEMVLNGTGDLFTMSHGEPFLGSTRYTVLITMEAKNLADQAMQAPFWFEFDTRPGPPEPAPVPLSSRPVSGSKNVSLDASIFVEFDREMNSTSTSVAASILPIVNGGQVYVAGRFLIWTHDQPMMQNTTYTFTIATSARSSGGTPLAEPLVLKFTTVAAPASPPGPSNSVPAPASASPTMVYATFAFSALAAVLAVILLGTRVALGRRIGRLEDELRESRLAATNARAGPTVPSARPESDAEHRRKTAMRLAASRIGKP